MGTEILKVHLCRNLKDQSQIKSKTELETHLTDSSHLDLEAEREISPLIVDEGDHTPDNSYANRSAQFIQSYGEGLTGCKADASHVRSIIDVIGFSPNKRTETEH